MQLGKIPVKSNKPKDTKNTLNSSEVTDLALKRSIFGLPEPQGGRNWHLESGYDLLKVTPLATSKARIQANDSDPDTSHSPLRVEGRVGWLLRWGHFPLWKGANLKDKYKKADTFCVYQGQDPSCYSAFGIVVFTLTPMGLGCPNFSLNETHLKEPDFEHLGSFFLDCSGKHSLGISRNIGTDIYSEIYPLWAPSFAIVDNKGLPGVSFCIQVVYGDLLQGPCPNANSSNCFLTTRFVCSFCITKAVLIQWGPSGKYLYKKKKIPITSNPDSHSDRTLVTCWHMFLVEKYRRAQKSTRQMSNFSLGCGDPGRACRTESTIHRRMCWPRMWGAGLAMAPAWDKVCMWNVAKVCLNSGEMWHLHKYPQTAPVYRRHSYTFVFATPSLCLLYVPTSQAGGHIF